MKQLWVEQYRPDTIDGYVFVDDQQRDQVKQWIQDGSIPHLMLSGSAGTGKTTLAKLLINELDVDEYDVMYANGSKEARKVEWVDRLISFCQTMPFGRFKVVLIDEADYMKSNCAVCIDLQFPTQDHCSVAQSLPRISHCQNRSYRIHSQGGHSIGHRKCRI